MQEAGVLVNDTSKIHLNDPGVEDHMISFPETIFCISLFLLGVLSRFPKLKVSLTKLQDVEDIYLLIPSQWNLCNKGYAHNEESMLDSKGYLVAPSQRKTIILLDVQEDESMTVLLELAH